MAALKEGWKGRTAEDGGRARRTVNHTLDELRRPRVWRDRRLLKERNLRTHRRWQLVEQRNRDDRIERQNDRVIVVDGHIIVVMSSVYVIGVDMIDVMVMALCVRVRQEVIVTVGIRRPVDVLDRRDRNRDDGDAQYGRQEALTHFGDAMLRARNGATEDSLNGRSGSLSRPSLRARNCWNGREEAGGNVWWRLFEVPIPLFENRAHLVASRGQFAKTTIHLGEERPA